MARILLSVGVTLLLLEFPLVPVPVSAQAPVTVSIDAPAEVAPDSHFTARVDITEVLDFDACQFDVTYDPNVIELTDVTGGEIGGTTIPIDMWGFIPPGEQGKARVIGNVPGVPGVSGSGYLAELHFHVVGSPGDISDIELSNGVLGDKDADPITPVTWVGDSVAVKGPPVADADGPYSGDRTGMVTLDGSDSYDPDGTIDNYEWQVDGAQVYSGPSATYDLALSGYSSGTHAVKLIVTDNDGATDDDTTTLTVSNAPPVALSLIHI